MILNEQFLRKYARQEMRSSITESMDSMKHFSYSEDYDIFLSHSSLDQELTCAVYDLFTQNGFKVYLDYEDNELNPDNVTSATGEQLRNRLKRCKCLAYITTSNIARSRWCPWELGLFDGITDAQIYVGNSEQHVCLGKMTGSVRLTNKVLACKGKIYPCNIKQCLRCKKYFISPRDFYSNSSLPDNYTYIEPANKVVSISPHDFIVRVNTNRCTSSGHRLKDIKCSVPLGLFSGGVRRVEVPAAYCYVCDKYYILESAVDFEILSREEICSHLDYLIHRSKGRLHYEDAISKWECDRTHIANYRSNELETIKAESISTKSRIRR